jgi:hypothetical protein
MGQDILLPNMDCIACHRLHPTFPQGGVYDVASLALAVLLYIDKRNAVFGQRKATEDWQSKIWAQSKSEVQNFF